MNAAELFSMPAPSAREIQGLGRETLLKLIYGLFKAGQEMRQEHTTMLENLTATQQRCTELLEEVRASRFVDACAKHDAQLLLPMVETLAKLAAATLRARILHPRGCHLNALVEEVGEVARARRRETPERVREELLDVAVVALRLYMGEECSDALVAEVNDRGGEGT